jgi:hypothetical protein
MRIAVSEGARYPPGREDSNDADRTIVKRRGPVTNNHVPADQLAK